MNCRCGILAMNMFNRAGVEYAPSQQQQRHNLTVCRILNDYPRRWTETKNSHSLLLIYALLVLHHSNVSGLYPINISKQK